MIHNLYKRLNRIKTLVRMQSSNISTSMDIHEVYSSRINELLVKVEHEYSKANISESVKIRLAAIQLALHYSHLGSLVHSSPPAASITAEIQAIEACLQAFDKFRSNDVICLVYFKTLNLMAKISYGTLKSSDAAKQWIQSADRMYKELLALQDGQRYYDCRELFSKSSILIPSRNGFETIDRLRIENNDLLEKIHQMELNEVHSIFEWLQTHRDHSIWLSKLLSIVPQLLEQREFKMVAYFLLIVMKLADDKGDTKVQSSIVTSWMYYFFGVFDRSQEHLLQKFADDEMMSAQKTFALKRIRQKAEKRDSHEKLEKKWPNAETMFNCFNDSIALTEDELKLCTNKLETVDDAKVLLGHSIEMVEKLIGGGDFGHSPMEFIVHHYQMSDLLSIAAILSDNPDDCFNSQVRRFQHFKEMIQWLSINCPDIYKAIATTFLNDLNEVILDLYAINYDRILNHMNFTNNDKGHIQHQIKYKLDELHEMNKTNKQTITADPVTKWI